MSTIHPDIDLFIRSKDRLIKMIREYLDSVDSSECDFFGIPNRYNKKDHNRDIVYFSCSSVEMKMLMSVCFNSIYRLINPKHLSQYMPPIYLIKIINYFCETGDDTLFIEKKDFKSGYIVGLQEPDFQKALNFLVCTDLHDLLKQLKKLEDLLLSIYKKD